jgi:3-methyladenine DNA glycosylase AlkC
MPEKLKHFFDEEVVRSIAEDLRRAYPALRAEAFVSECLAGLDGLELLARGRRIADVMHDHLPRPFPAAADVLTASLGPELSGTDGFGMAPFRYLPHVAYVQKHGLDHFDAAMRAQYELTKRFSAEMSIRPYLEKHRDAALARLAEWARDPNAHVRRLVSEGTRPRLPWAPRLREFQKNPRPVLALLEKLKDDPELYVRRSVANNLNDIGKDHPDVLAQVARAWSVGAGEERMWIIRHALRSAVKRGEAGALKALGYGHAVEPSIQHAAITPRRASIGGAVEIAFDLVNQDGRRLRAMVDCQVHFIKANGKPSPKTFKIKSIDLEPGASVRMRKIISLAEMTTRKHHPGTHRVELLLNGRPRPLGFFELLR